MRPEVILATVAVGCIAWALAVDSYVPLVLAAVAVIGFEVWWLLR